jgi:DnaJ domain
MVNTLNIFFFSPKTKKMSSSSFDFQEFLKSTRKRSPQEYSKSSKRSPQQYSYTFKSSKRSSKRSPQEYGYKSSPKSPPPDLLQYQKGVFDMHKINDLRSKVFDEYLEALKHITDLDYLHKKMRTNRDKLQKSIQGLYDLADRQRSEFMKSNGTKEELKKLFKRHEEEYLAKFNQAAKLSPYRNPNASAPRANRSPEPTVADYDNFKGMANHFKLVNDLLDEYMTLATQARRNGADANYLNYLWNKSSKDRQQAWVDIENLMDLVRRQRTEFLSHKRQGKDVRSLFKTHRRQYDHEYSKIGKTSPYRPYQRRPKYTHWWHTYTGVPPRREAPPRTARSEAPPRRESPRREAPNVNFPITPQEAVRQLKELAAKHGVGNTSKLRNLYRALALKIHPDKNPDPDANAQFQKLNELWQIAKDGGMAGGRRR